MKLILLLIVMDRPCRKRVQSRERGSYRAYLKNPNVSPSKLPRTSLYRHKKSKQIPGENHTPSSLTDDVCNNGKTTEQTDGNPEYGYVDVAGPSTIKQGEEVEMFETEVNSEGVETEVNFCDQDTFSYPGDSFLDDSCVEENNETGDKDDEDIDLLQEILDHDLDDISDSNDEPEITISEKPIFEGSPLTLTMHIIAIITFAMTEHLSGSTLAHLLTLIWLHCPKPNNCVKSLKQLWGFFKDFKNPIEWHYMCSNCHKYIGKQKPQSTDYCLHCTHDFKMGRFKSWHPFIVFPIVQQLLCFFEDKLFVSQLDYKFKHEQEKRERGTPDHIEDIIDGENFKRFFREGGFLRNRYHLAFQMNTDGVALFKSSTFSIWPVYMIICDLPPGLRYTRKYRIFAGLWFGYTKPIFSTFMQPFIEIMQQLYRDGFSVKIPFEDKLVTVRGITISSSMDAPAKCLFMCMQQFNGRCGCPYCTTSGTNVRTEKGGNCRTYPYVKKSNRAEDMQARTHEQTFQDATMAREQKLAGKKNPEVNGIKGLSTGFGLPGYDIIKGTSIDYMHTVLLGIVKMLMSRWFDTTYRHSPYYCGDKISICDSRRANIKPPNNISRIPRSLYDRTHYKASEYRTWLLYYSLPVMRGILQQLYFDHFMLLVCAVFILLKTSISECDIQQASQLLEHFCLRAENLYDARIQTFNLHQLLHLTDCVINNGPLWSCSCFFFEDLNGDVRNLFHGSQNPESQIVKAVSVIQHLPKLRDSLPVSDVKTFCKTLVTKKETGYVTEVICESKQLYVVGAVVEHAVDLPVAELEETQLCLGDSSDGLTEKPDRFARLKHGKDVFHSEIYTRATKRNSFVVAFREKGEADVCFGAVMYYLRCKLPCSNALCVNNCTCANKTFLAMIKKFQRDPSGPLKSSSLKGPLAIANHLVVVHREKFTLTCIPVSDILYKCFFIDIGSGCLYVGIAPNTIESD